MATVVLAAPAHAPCTAAEYLVRIRGGAAVRSSALVTAAPCADETCETRLPSREVPGRLDCAVAGRPGDVVPVAVRQHHAFDREVLIREERVDARELVGEDAGIEIGRAHV